MWFRLNRAHISLFPRWFLFLSALIDVQPTKQRSDLSPLISLITDYSHCYWNSTATRSQHNHCALWHCAHSRQIHMSITPHTSQGVTVCAASQSINNVIIKNDNSTNENLHFFHTVIFPSSELAGLCMKCCIQHRRITT